jgi:hypothetical protein
MRNGKYLPEFLTKKLLLINSYPNRAIIQGPIGTLDLFRAEEDVAAPASRN